MRVVSDRDDRGQAVGLTPRNGYGKARSRYRRPKINWGRYESAAEALGDNLAWAKPSRPVMGANVAFEPPQNIAGLSRLLRATDRPRTLGQEVSIRAYASDRVVLASYPEPARVRELARAVGNRRKDAATVLRLDKLHESRRALKVGSRWRYKPRETKFTNYGKNFVRDACHLIERDVAGSAVFLTLTFPGRSELALQIYSHVSGYLVDRFNRWLRYKCAGGLYCYVWELTKKGAPHLHYLFKTTGGVDAAAIGEQCKSEWQKILLDVCEQTQCDLFERSQGGTWIADTEKPYVAARDVYVGIANYLSKYMSKGQGKASAKARWRPGRWWRCSQPLKALVLRARLHVTVRHESSRSSRLWLAQSISFASELFTSVKHCDPARCHGALVVSCAVHPRYAKRVALALESWARTGEVCAVAALVVEIRAFLNRPPDSGRSRGDYAKSKSKFNALSKAG